MPAKPTSLSGQLADIDLKLLRVFKTVVECGGFSAAEVELNIGRSAISRQMSDLETRLDIHLWPWRLMLAITRAHLVDWMMQILSMEPTH